jgi:hypothetical protein
MTTTSTRFLLTFNSNLGRIIQFSIPRALSGKTVENTEAAMNAIIANGAVAVANKGVPASIEAAKIISTERKVVI